MHSLEMPFTEILQRQAGRMFPFLSLTRFCLQAWNQEAGYPYSRQTSNVMNQDKKLHRPEEQRADFLKIILSFLFKILSMFETELT